MALKLKPITLKQAKDYVSAYHRHHKAPVGHKFSVGCTNSEGDLVGVVCVGRPVARALDDGYTAEVNRMCSDGTKNVCSMLYGAAARAAKAMGYTNIITYTLASENGASLRASGWTCEGVIRKDGKGWSSRKGRKENHVAAKQRWRKVLA